VPAWDRSSCLSCERVVRPIGDAECELLAETCRTDRATELHVVGQVIATDEAVRREQGVRTLKETGSCPSCASHCRCDVTGRALERVVAERRATITRSLISIPSGYGRALFLLHIRSSTTSLTIVVQYRCRVYDTDTWAVYLTSKLPKMRPQGTLNLQLPLEPWNGGPAASSVPSLRNRSSTGRSC
jgi:hypothetical protein